MLNYSKGKSTIKFINTGYVTTVSTATLVDGRVKDRFEPSICGVGYLGECQNASHFQKEYNLWKGIIERCYNSNRHDYMLYGKKGVTVCERWKNFSNFLEDIKNIDGYNDEQFKLGNLDLDKDIKQAGVPTYEKVYSLETCMFIDKRVNRAITTREPTSNVKIKSIKDNDVLITDCPVEELGRLIGIKTQYITRILRGEAKTHKGWTFEYINL